MCLRKIFAAICGNFPLQVSLDFVSVACCKGQKAVTVFRPIKHTEANMEKVPPRLVFVAVCTKAHASLAQGCESSKTGFVMSSLAVSVPNFLRVAALARMPAD